MIDWKIKLILFIEQSYLVVINFDLLNCILFLTFMNLFNG